MKKEKECKHSKIRNDYFSEDHKDWQVLRCEECGKTWQYNPLLNVWSDSFLGTWHKKEK